MKNLNTGKIVLHAVEAAYAAGLLAWAALVWLGMPVASFSLASLMQELAGPGPNTRAVAALVTPFAALVPPLCLWKLLSLFLARRLPTFCDPDRPLPTILNIVLTADVIGLLIVHLLRYAASGAYFVATPPAQYAVFLASVVWNAASIVLLLSVLNRRNPSYREYLEFRRAGEQGALAILSRGGIQRRLAFTYIPLIGAIIAVLAWVLLRDYSATVLASVMDSGTALAERTATTAKTSVEDLIAVDDYLLNLARSNEKARFPFETVTVYLRVAKGGAQAITSTDRQRIGKTTPTVETVDGTVQRYVPTSGLFEFLSPISLSGKYLGWVDVEYARDVIYEPVFRTQVKVVLIAALFIYAASFLTYLFGRALVFPILFLRMSVNAIATVLGDMIRGRVRVSPELLQYRDRVTTRDEIRSLSREIGNMTTVIRGVIPYISTSTLRHAEREKPETERRDLAFLFTDIRGFTTFCEGKAPQEVVTMLNRYLDIQASIIYDNHGDVDKFVGDAVMGRFEGPKKELHACRASMAIRSALAEEQDRARAAGAEVISIGIGINSGPVVFGSIGAKDRMDFTGIGDTVNLAARLEGANKTYGTKTLLAEIVHERVSSAYLCREIDLITVKGKRQPVRIYELLQEKAKASERLTELARVFEEGLGLYRKQKWSAAEKAFRYLAEKLSDEPSKAFLRRIELFRKSAPPQDWEGVFEMTVK